mgnify:CR=1 FL=1
MLKYISDSPNLFTSAYSGGVGGGRRDLFFPEEEGVGEAGREGEGGFGKFD